MKQFGLSLCLSLLTIHALIAQDRLAKVIGLVRLVDGKPAVTIAVSLKGTRYGAVVQTDGRFAIEAPAGSYTLAIQGVGLTGKEMLIQLKSGETFTIPAIIIQESAIMLQDVVVTGQYEPQSVRQSVYQIRTIDRERIQQRAATNLVGVLNTELGIRFSNDQTLGTTDIQLMGMSGRSVKILLDGVPMLDRGDTRESLSQIDINTIDRIEIVEGPMSVSYGSDALAGVINIITKKPGQEQLSVLARLQEETAGNEYNAMINKGAHNQSITVAYQRKNWNISVGGTHNDFGGWQGRSVGRVKDWKPKEQLLGNVKLGYRTSTFNAWYRLDALDETITSEGPVNINTNVARDQNYLTSRFTHQAQSDWTVNDRLHLNTILSYTDYSRRTQTTNLDLNTGKRTLSLGTGEQDLSKFTSQVFRTTAQYKISSMVSLQPGIDINIERATGARILGSPVISDYALFVSAEVKPSSAINLRPGLRFVKNSVYNAPPVIPSLNAKLALSKKTDLRLAYARGFRAPALRELYFNFFDASHSITGNPTLKAEYSNSINGSINWQGIATNKIRFVSVLTGFYNDFHNLINYGYSPQQSGVMMTINIDRYKTTGGTFINTLNLKQLQASLGFSYIGRYNSLIESNNTLPEFVWSPEINTNITYDFQKIGTKLSFFYKYTGKRPAYETSIGSNGQTSVRLAETAAYHWGDVTISKALLKYITLTGGVKNVFNVTQLTNSSTDVGGAHSTGGLVPLSYGRSYFLGLNFQWSKR